MNLDLLYCNPTVIFHFCFSTGRTGTKRNSYFIATSRRRFFAKCNIKNAVLYHYSSRAISPLSLSHTYTSCAPKPLGLTKVTRGAAALPRDTQGSRWPASSFISITDRYGFEQRALPRPRGPVCSVQLGASPEPGTERAYVGIVPPSLTDTERIIRHNLPLSLINHTSHQHHN